MSSVREGVTRDGSGHCLAFRVMRLCRPALQVDLPLKYDPEDIWYGEDEEDIPPRDRSSEGSAAEDLFLARAELSQPLDAFGLTGMMVLPQAFGSIYLGETFCSYISVGNHTNQSVTNVQVKAELQTERQRLVLADNSKTPIDVLGPEGRHDFIIEHDIKELGAHTLVCSATYIDPNGEQKFLPQYFKFVASNPLSVRTKVRTVKGGAGLEDHSFLEACIENCTKGALFLDYVKFEPAPAWSVTPLEPSGEGASSEEGAEDEAWSPFSRQPNLISASGGIRHFLYSLRRIEAGPGTPLSTSSSPPGGGTSLGKLEMRWRSTLGEPGRLQTQQILGNPIPRKEVELRLLELPSTVVLEHPFLVKCRVFNCTDRTVGPLRVILHREGSSEGKAIVVSGPWALMVPEMEQHSSVDVSVCLVALASGVQRMSGISVEDQRDGKPYDTLAPTEVFVELP
eukprot:TRINITY_DN38520_c0_g1_i1.p1 TRINITY_DN38520_c0_g1~~TRINITY_DN38520_c0_g1_i1.p1  ORF type:complete len:454 (-),score=82.78 TRINITY_DN38520_c0_g1_i1:56-1417(-)